MKWKTRPEGIRIMKCLDGMHDSTGGFSKRTLKEEEHK